MSGCLKSAIVDGQSQPVPTQEFIMGATRLNMLADNVNVWRYDKADFSMRFDVESGPLEEILLGEVLDSSAMAAQTSGKRVSGKRVSGKRMSGD